MLQKAFELTGDILGRTSGEVEAIPWWPEVSAMHLERSKKALSAVKLLLENQLDEPAEVVVRYLFETAVTLKYIAKDVTKRLPAYLKHSGIALTPQEIAVQQAEVQTAKDSRDFSGASEWIPKSGWINVKTMCEDIGCLEHYQTMYRSTSATAHSGASGIGTVGQLTPEWKLATLMVTALESFSWVVEIFDSANAAWYDGLAALEEQISGAMDDELSEHETSQNP